MSKPKTEVVDDIMTEYADVFQRLADTPTDRFIMNKPKRKTVKTIIVTWVLNLAALAAIMVSVVTANATLLLSSMAVFGFSSLASFIAGIIGLVILYKKKEALVATVWLTTVVLAAVMPMSAEGITSINVNTLFGLANFGATIWGIVKLWEIGGRADA